MLPKVEINYTTTPIIFYRMFCLDDMINYNYIGSTTNIDRRLREHKSRCYDVNCSEYKCKLYNTIRKTGGFKRWITVVLEKKYCHDKNDRLITEKDFIKNYNCMKCNKNIPIILEEERKQYNKKYQHNYYMKQKLIKLQKGLPLITSLPEIFLQVVPLTEVQLVQQQVQLVQQ